jgi:hypothetical protein
MILAGIAVLNCIMVFLAFRRVPIEEREEVVKVKEPGTDVDIDEKPIAKRGRFMQVITMRFTWTVAIFLLLHVGMGTTIGSWGYTYLTTARNGDPVQMARVSSGRFVCIHNSSFLMEDHPRLCPVFGFVFSVLYKCHIRRR